MGCHGNIKINEHLPTHKFLNKFESFMAFGQILNKLLRFKVAGDRIRPPTPVHGISGSKLKAPCSA